MRLFPREPIRLWEKPSLRIDSCSEVPRMAQLTMRDTNSSAGLLVQYVEGCDAARVDDGAASSRKLRLQAIFRRFWYRVSRWAGMNPLSLISLTRSRRVAVRWAPAVLITFSSIMMLPTSFAPQ